MYRHVRNRKSHTARSVYAAWGVVTPEEMGGEGAAEKTTNDFISFQLLCNIIILIMIMTSAYTKRRDERRRCV